jgi:hypothetical protein
MNQGKSEIISTIVKVWALRAGLAGIFGGSIMVLSKGGGIGSLIGAALPIGLFFAAIGAAIGAIVALVRGKQ